MRDLGAASLVLCEDGVPGVSDTIEWLCSIRFPIKVSRFSQLLTFPRNVIPVVSRVFCDVAGCQPNAMLIEECQNTSMNATNLHLHATNLASAFQRFLVDDKITRFLMNGITC